MGRKTRHNRIVSPELMEQVNPQNLQLMKDFLLYMKSVQRSPTTIEAYENDLKIFMVWCLQHANNKFFIDLKIRDFVNFQAYLQEDNENSPARIRRIKATVSSFSNTIELLYSEEYPTFRNLIKKVESPVNTPVREKTVLSDEQIDTLLHYFANKGEHEKACCFALAAYSGRRKSELFRYKVSDFAEDHIVFGTLYKSDPIQTKGRGKNGKMLTCYTLAAPFKPYFDAWMKQREELGIQSKWLFPDPEDASKARGADSINSWARQASRILGTDVYPHSFRHRACTRLAEAGLPDDVIKNLFGWQSIDLVSVYKDIDPITDLAKYFQDGEIVAPKSVGISDL